MWTDTAVLIKDRLSQTIEAKNRLADQMDLLKSFLSDVFIYEDENIWLTQKMMTTLYDVGTNIINYHIKKVFEDSELQFRKWVNQIAKDYTIKAWVMDDERLKRGTYLTEKYFDEAVRSEAGLNRFVMTPTKWIEQNIKCSLFLLFHIARTKCSLRQSRNSAIFT